LLARQGILVAFAVFMIGFTLANERFLDPDNIMGVVRSSAILGVMALGVTFVVISGNLDLSVGSMMSFSTIVVLDLHDKIGPALAIPACCDDAVPRGLHRLSGRLPQTQFADRHARHAVGHPWPDADLFGRQEHGHRRQGGHLVQRLRPGRCARHSRADPDLRPLAALLGIVLAKTPFGRKVYAVGGNGTAATFSGIRRARVVFTCYLLSAFCVATAGLIQASRSLGSQNTVGQGLELEVLAAVILGGASLLGGSGTIFKTVIGVLILGFIQNGLLLVGLQFYAQYVVTWIIIILAVWLDIAAKRGKLWSPIA
jgi:ribose transport system permease protein